jgi:SnoaL-like protein
MKARLLIPLAGLAISFALPIFAQQTNTPHPQSRQRLVEVIKKHGHAMNANDAAAAAACFTEDAVYVTDTGPVNGRELSRSGMQTSSGKCILAIISSRSIRIPLTL